MGVVGGSSGAGAFLSAFLSLPELLEALELDRSLEGWRGLGTWAGKRKGQRTGLAVAALLPTKQPPPSLWGSPKTPTALGTALFFLRRQGRMLEDDL